MRKRFLLILILLFVLPVIFSFKAVRAASDDYNRKSGAQEDVARCWCHVTSLMEAYDKKEMEVQEMVKEAAHTAEALENYVLKTFSLGKIAAGLNLVNQKAASELIDQALETANQIYSASYRNDTTDLKETVKLWKEEDQKKISAIMERIENTVSRAWLLRVLASVTIDINPFKATKIFDKAVEKAETIRNPQDRDLDLRAIAGEMAKLNTQRATQIAVKIKDLKMKTWALRTIASEHAKQGSDEALKIWQMAIEAGKKVQPASTRAIILSKIALEISGIDRDRAIPIFNKAIEIAEKIEKPYTRAYTLSDVGNALAQADPEDAARVAQMIDRQYADARFSVLINIARKTYRQDALERAATAAQEIEEPYDRAKALGRAAIAMNRINKDRALELLNMINYPYIYSDTFSRISVKWSWKDEKEVFEAVRNIEDHFIRSNTLKEIGVLVSKDDKRKAEKLFSKAISIAEEIKSTFLLWEITAERTKTGKDKLLDMAEKIQGDEHYRAMALREIALDWSKSDTSKAEVVLDMAIKSAEKIEDAYVRSELLREMGVEWAELDKAKASAIFKKAVEAAKNIGIVGEERV